MKGDGKINDSQATENDIKDDNYIEELEDLDMEEEEDMDIEDEDADS